MQYVAIEQDLLALKLDFYAHLMALSKQLHTLAIPSPIPLVEPVIIATLAMARQDNIVFSK